jgi:hypothetical protein
LPLNIFPLGTGSKQNVAGTVLGFSAILLPQLSAEQDLTEADKSWIASLSNIGQYSLTFFIKNILFGKIKSA